MEKNIYQQIAEKTTRIRELFDELSMEHFPRNKVTSLECYRLPQSLGVEIRADNTDMILADTFLGEVKCIEEDGVLTAQIPLVNEKTVKIHVANSPAFTLKPGNLHKKVLPDLLKADFWNYMVMDKVHLDDVLALVGNDYKRVPKTNKIYYFDASLEWLIEEEPLKLKVFGVSKKYGLLFDIRQKIKVEKPLELYEQLRECLKAEMNLFDDFKISNDVTEIRRKLMSLQIETDLIACQILD